MTKDEETAFRADLKATLNKAEDSMSVIQIGVGAASMCWQYPAAAGVFLSDQAAIVAEEICYALERWGLPE